MVKDEVKSTKPKITKGEWNSKLEEVARGIGQAAQGYKHMHIWEAQRADNTHKRFNRWWNSIRSAGKCYI